MWLELQHHLATALSSLNVFLPLSMAAHLFSEHKTDKTEAYRSTETASTCSAYWISKVPSLQHAHNMSNRRNPLPLNWTVVVKFYNTLADTHKVS
jgi:hypothetical protein